MSVKWTEEQQKVIDLRDRNILVSAAAGSGKTAVLVERIISRITDENDPADVDRLLVVTYTEAAAAEMKERIGAAIEKKLEEQPGNVNLEQQSTLIHNASIMTIHSFCLSVIRDHFHVIGIDPAFRIAEEGELRLLMQDVLEELIENFYAEGSEAFLNFVDQYGTGRNDQKIEELILQLYEYSRSYPQPEKWLKECVDNYEIDSEKMEEADVVQEAKARVRQNLTDVKGFVQQAIEVCELPAGPYMYGEMLDSDLVQIEQLEKAETFCQQEQIVSDFTWKRLSGKKDPTVDPELKEKAQGLRKQAKKLIEDLKANYFYAPVDEWIRDMQEAKTAMKMLVLLVQAFAEAFSEKKRQRNLLDFSDMEQFALQILTEEKEGKLVPSAVAQEYQERFEEVMIDEYQDSNLVQETILTSVSRESAGQNNLFMVGDVKQSIYRFRLSRPELFMGKYNSYSTQESSRQRIDLDRNFRSRGEVLDSTNYIFRKLMRKEFGEIIYDDKAALHLGASFPELPDENVFTDQTELLLYNQTGLRSSEAREEEARMIAQRMKELLSTGVVLDKGTGEYRPVHYRDMVILTRSLQGWAEVFASILAEEGIPAYSVSREGYFETYEVSVLLDYLKVLDNARQDLPMTAVLTSPFAGLTAAELSVIRLAYPNQLFYEAVEGFCSLSSEEIPETVDKKQAIQVQEKLRKFFEVLDHFREILPYTAIHDLLAEIIDKTGYGLFISAMPGGAQRQANVEMLVEKARAFEGTSYKGLFNFVRYIEQLKKYDVDYGEASIIDEQDDTVRIMSIHKSKGLEFPIVFVAGTGKQFNTQDLKGSIVIHPRNGVGIDVVDLEMRTKAPTFLKKMIQEKTKLENLAEELRVLYVAMTRAKEKLILTGSLKIGEDGLEPYVNHMTDRESSLSLYQLEGANRYLDWILPALLQEEDLKREADLCGILKTESEEVQQLPIKVRIFDAGEMDFTEDAQRQAEVIAREVLEHWDTTKVYLPGAEEKLEQQMNFLYPYKEEGKMKLKFTVSELKKRESLQEEAGEELIQEPEIVPLLPHFMEEQKEGLTGASRGSAYHKFLELHDFSKEYTEELLKEEIERFYQAGRLSKEMADCIRTKDILAFLNSESGRRMTQAAGNGKLRKEQPFVLGVAASEIYPEIYQDIQKRSQEADENRKEETILIQGIIDVWFEEEDGLVLLDYKTDRVRNASQLKELYHAQLDYYAQALEQLLEKPVKEKIIYSFALKEEIIL